MRRIIILAAVTALTVARPDVYKEKEDFKYSRSSSDDGTKSGYYGAQRGNMGGNYERAHNMDSLAQHQMSGLVNQVDGELGDGAKTRTGSVYTAANSRGVYGSGHYDLSNLAGRNFQEGATFGDSQSRSSSSQGSSAYNNAAYTNSQSQSSRYGGYQAAGQTGQSYQTADLQPLDNAQGATGGYNYGQQSSSGYNSQSGYNSHTSYGSSDALTHSGSNDGSGVRSRFISTIPVRIVFRPGTRVAIPIGTQTYDTNQRSTVYDANQESSYDAHQRSASYDTNQRSSSYDQSSVNTEAEALRGTQNINGYKPANDAKQYQSSYSYHKEWERHNTIAPTLSTITDNPLPQNSELYEDSQSRASNHQYDAVASGSQSAHLRNAYTGYNSNVKSSSGQSRYGLSSNSQQHQLASDSNLNAYTQAGYNTGSNGDLNSQVESINSQKPKSYHSSYSYHKSWERQGDPYVIKPAYDSQSPQRLSAGTKSAYGTGSHHQSQVDCDEICGHGRVARSYDAAQYQQELGQQSQNLEDFGQQSQQIENLGQQSQNLEDFGQQSQQLENLGQQSQNLEDFGQQSQQLENLGQQSQNLEDFGQQSQQLENLGQQSQNLEDFGQKSQKLEDFGQQSQQLENLGQQSETWEGAEDLGQHTQHHPEQISEDLWNKQERNPQEDDQQTQNTWDFKNTNASGQQITQHQSQYIENIHIPQNEWNQQQFNQPRRYSQSTPNDNDDKHKHKVQTIWDKLNIDKIQHSNDNAQTVQEQSITDNLQDNNGRQHIQSTYEHNWDEDSAKTGNGHTQNNKQQFTTNYKTYSHNYQSHSQHNSALFNLWSKLDTTEKQLEASSNKSRDVKYNSSNDYTSAQSFTGTHTHKQTYYEEGLVNTTKSHYNEQKNETFNFNRAQSEEEEVIVRPQDIGRGDIGAEDLSTQAEVDRKEKTLNYSNIDKKPLISVTSGVLNSYNEMNEKDSTDQQIPKRHDGNPPYVPNVPTSISSNNNTAEQDQRFKVLEKEMEAFDQQTVNSLGQKHRGSQNFAGHGKDLKELEVNDLKTQKEQQQLIQENGNAQQQNAQDYGQLNKNMDQQDTPNFSHQNNNLEQQNVQDFGQKNKNLRQENLQQFSQNINQQTVADFGQQNANLDQQNARDFGQPNENLSQQNTQNFNQQNNNFEQQNVQDFDQQNENLGQESLQDFGQNIDHHVADFGQQNENLEQQDVQDFGQQNENLEQQNLQDFGQNIEQHVADFGQESRNFEQQNVRDFSQQNENLEKQNSQDFGKPNENLDQQNTQTLNQQNNYFEQQNLQDLGQQNENLGQQNLQDFGQNIDHHVADFGQQNENLEQQDVKDFGQENENLEQQNLQDFGQNIDQHVADFGQESRNFEQQNVRDFGQQNENLEKQNSQDFGQPNEDLDQKNTQNLNQQNYNLEQQNVQDFGQNIDHHVPDFGQENENLEHREQKFEQQNKKNYNLQQEYPGQGHANHNQHIFHDFKQESISIYQQQQSNNHEPLENNGQVETKWRPHPERIEVIPVVEAPQNVNSQTTPPKSIIPGIEPPPEPTTVKPGFWKSVGNKFVNAKDKVFSWFGS